MKKQVIAVLAVCVFSFAFTLGAIAENGAAFYKKTCASCHGQNAEKKSGNNPALKDYNEAKIKEMLTGYRNGNYGGAQKAMMKRIAKKLSEQEVNDVAAFIGTLK